MIASALDRPLHLALEDEITGRGIAILACCALNAGSLSDYPPALASTVYPQPRQVAALKAARERQERVYKLLVEEN
jgi:sugar (pentulose or hexulose) kinase